MSQNSIATEIEGRWVNEWTWRRRDGKLFHTLRGARKLGLNETSVHLWGTKPCRYLGGRTIDLEIVASFQNGSPRRKEVTVYSREDLLAINAQKKGSNKVLFQNENGDWLTDRQLRAQLGFGKDAGGWAARLSTLRPGEAALRSKQIPNPTPRGRRTIIVRCVIDAHAILDGKEGPRLAGPPETRAARRKNAKRQAVKWLRSFLHGHARLAAETNSAAKEQGFTRRLLEHAKSELNTKRRRKGMSGPYEFYLGAEPPPLPERFNATRQAVLNYLESNGAKSRAEIAAALGKTPAIIGQQLMILRAKGLVAGERKEGAWSFEWRAVIDRTAPIANAHGNTATTARSKGGRPPSQETAAMNELCYTMRVAKNDNGEWKYKYVEIRSAVVRRFEVELTNSQINHAAKRHAESKGLPFLPRS